MGTERIMQPSLFHVPVTNDIVTTPPALAEDIVVHFNPSGICLDPCRGNGVFYTLLPRDSLWCEIEQNKDFYAFNSKVDWIIGNPPYSHYTAWLRHSLKIAKNIVYLMPVYKVFQSGNFLEDLFNWGGIFEIRRYGTGTQWGLPFGYALSAVHYQKKYDGPTNWSKYQKVY